MRWRTVAVSVAVAGGVALFAGTLWAVDPAKLWVAIRTITPWQFGVFVALSTLNFILQVWRWDILLKAQQIHRPFGRLIEMKLSAFAITYLTPLADLMGEGVRAYLLSRERVRPSLALATAAADKLVEWIVHIGLTLVLLAAAMVGGSLPLTSPRILVVLGALVFLFFVLGSRLVEGRGIISPFIRLLHLERIRQLREVAKSIDRFEGVLADYLLTKRAAVVKTVAVSAVTTLITFADVWLVLGFLGHAATLAEVVIIQTMLVAVYATPNVAALGVGDFGGAATFQALGLGAVSGVAFTFLVRAKDLIFAGLGVLSFFGFLRVDTAMVKQMLRSWNNRDSIS